MYNNHVVIHTVNYIENNLFNDISLEKISEEIKYSKFHLNRIFTKKVGLTIHKYIQLRRLTKAAEKLTKTNISILDIALETNYSSHQSFTLAFKKVYGCTPQNYRLTGVFMPIQNKFVLNANNNIISFKNSYIRNEVAA